MKVTPTISQWWREPFHLWRHHDGVLPWWKLMSFLQEDLPVNSVTCHKIMSHILPWQMYLRMAINGTLLEKLYPIQLEYDDRYIVQIVHCKFDAYRYLHMLIVSLAYDNRRAMESPPLCQRHWPDSPTSDVRVITWAERPNSRTADESSTERYFYGALTMWNNN